MDDMVYSALRRKLAAAQAIGDLERMDRLRGMMAVSADVSSEVSADVIEVVERLIDPVIDPPDGTDLDVEATVDTDE